MLLTVDIVASYVSNNTVAADDLPAVIDQVYQSLRKIENGQSLDAAPDLAVPVKRSITPDFIICLEDGKKLKMLRRHLRSRYGLTPDEYRERWGLPANYPMVAPNYAKKRRELAKKIGLGKKKPGRTPGRAKGRK